VIGTLLALLVFFSLFGVFLTQYVPLWMEENEVGLSNQLETSLATLKSGIDDQYAIGGIPIYSVPFTLGSQSVPLLAQPTIATLSYLSGCPGGFYSANFTPRQIGACSYEHINYTAGRLPAGSTNISYGQTSLTDYLEIAIPSRYSQPVTYFLEDDGVTQAADGVHQVMVAAPAFNVSKTAGGVVAVTSNIIVFLGTAGTYSGQGSKNLVSTFVSSTNVTSANRFRSAAGVSHTFNFTYSIGVHDVCGWYNYLYNTTYQALGASSSSTWTIAGATQGASIALPPSPSICQESLTQTFDLSLKIFGVSSAFNAVAQLQLSFNAGGL